MMRWLLALVLAAGALPAGAQTSEHRHIWYDGFCCNEGDCYQTATGEVQYSEQGWFIRSTGEVIPFDDTRIKYSMDEFVHRCIFKSAIVGLRRIGDTRCLYVSSGG